MVIAYLALGSNLRQPERQLRLAIRSLKALEKSQVLRVAPFYYNKAQGRRAQPDFCNTVLALKTQLPPQALLRACQRIEKQLGRVRKIRWGARLIDIDILLYGQKTINSPTLTIPHPHMENRDFVQIPLTEILSKKP